MERKARKPIPELSLLEQELAREQYRVRYFQVLRSTIYGLITIIAIVLLLATILFPVLHIYGSTMAPTLNDGEIVMLYKKDLPRQDEVIAFYFDNKILIRRVIGIPGDVIEIKSDGSVYVNEQRLPEKFAGMDVGVKAFGDTNIEYPYVVPADRYFVLGDNRKTAIDSRNTVIGCVAEEQLIGRIFLRVWPLSEIGWVS